VVLAAFAMKPLLVVDETRYLSVAWEMWNNGSFLVPHLNDAPYAHKPPFLFWLMHAGWIFTGPQEWWPRLLGPIALCLDAVLTVRLARGLWPDVPRIAPLAGMLFAGTLFPVLFATGVMFDLWATLWVLLGLTALVQAHQGASLRRTAPLAIFALGMGILTKGPVLLLYLLPPAFSARHWSGAHGGAWKKVIQTGLLGLVGGAVLALCWAIPAGIVGGQEYRDAIFWGQTAGRLENSFDHARPFWWYLPLLPAMLFPWVWWPHALRGWKLIRAQAPDFTRLLAWSLLPQFLVFSAISGKQPHYLLPMMPIAAIALAFQLHARPVASGRSLILPFGLLGTIGLGFFSAPIWMTESTAPTWLRAGNLMLCGSILLLGLAVLAWTCRHPQKRNLAMASLAPGLVMIILFGLGPDFRTHYDIQPAADLVKTWRSQEPDRPIAFHGMEYAGQFHFLGRLERPIDNPQTTEQIETWLSANPEGHLLLVVKRDEPLPYGESKTPPLQFGSRLIQPWTASDLEEHRNAQDTGP
jgi:4-amino-4-deoxy-L-arabinose transferase-like glycosyltransferase